MKYRLTEEDLGDMNREAIVINCICNTNMQFSWQFAADGTRIFECINKPTDAPDYNIKFINMMEV